MKLTPFAKLFVALVVLSATVYVVKVNVLDKPRPGPFAGPSGSLPEPVSPTKSPLTPAKPWVIGINDFGGGYPLLLANGGAKAAPDSLFQKAGLDVEVRLIRGSKERLKAFDSGEVDVMLLTLDYLANLVPVYKQKGVNLQAFLFAAWSRGSLGLIAKPEFQSIESLKAARIATTRNTPTHYFLLSLLDKSNLKPAEIESVKTGLMFAQKTPDAATLFSRGEVDAVALWEPHLSEAMASGKGHALVTTETATNVVADVLFARTEFLTQNRDKLPTFAQAFFAAVEELRTEAGQKKTVELGAAAFSQKAEQIEQTLKKVKAAQFADNRAFFGLETEECAYDSLYTEASLFWQREGLIKETVPAANTKWTATLAALAPQWKDQKVTENFQFSPSQNAPRMSLLTKSMSIYFSTGQTALDPNARKTLDSLGMMLTMFQNTLVRVEGNTDSVGNRAANLALSQKRAQAVVQYLVDRHRFDRNRFLAVGNGPDRPVADNKTPEGREQNRRTDFKLLKNAAM